MYTRLLNTWAAMRASFWFVPVMMVMVGVGVAFGLIWVDSAIGGWAVKRFTGLKMSPGSAQSILAAIASAIVTSTGMVFSITILAISIASSQFGSRLIRTFQNHGASQATLGLFVATSLYCIIVLAAIRDIGDSPFVPELSVSVGILLGLTCLMALIYYIHDISHAIQAPNVIRASASDLEHALKRLFPKRIGRSPGEVGADDGKPEPEFDSSALRDRDQIPVVAESVGYIQGIENETLLSLACEHNLVVALRVQPGDFIFEGSPVADIHWTGDFDAQEYQSQRGATTGTRTDTESGHSDGNADETARKQFENRLADKIRKVLIVGSQRTPTQDIRYAFSEVVEIAVRALSPGINDPFTAVTCVDHIHAALTGLLQRKPIASHRYDKEGRLRVVAVPVSFAVCLRSSLGIIRQYQEGHPMVVDRLNRSVEQMLETTRSRQHRRVLQDFLADKAFPNPFREDPMSNGEEPLPAATRKLGAL